MLISYLATPAKTQLVILQWHNWARARRRRIIAVIVGVAALFLMATCMPAVLVDPSAR
ncbi:MAG: hypothetical protein WB967_07175 [Mycobacterium sp.]|uniref:GAP family protein n=1 Tax=Mycobacterium sp. TaxID=1785 RepID=UPI003BB807DF